MISLPINIEVDITVRGKKSYGIYLIDNFDPEFIEIPTDKSTTAEFIVCLAALDRCLYLGLDQKNINIFTDSLETSNLISNMKNKAKYNKTIFKKKENSLSWFTTSLVFRYLDRFKNLNITWIPRELNSSHFLLDIILDRKDIVFEHWRPLFYSSYSFRN